MTTLDILIWCACFLIAIFALLGTIVWLWRFIFPQKPSSPYGKALSEITKATASVFSSFFLMLLRILRTVLMFLSKLFYAFAGGKKKAKNGEAYTGRYLSNSERNRLFSRRNKGLVVNGKRRITEKQSYRHLLVVGNSGAGKSTVFTFGNILRERRASLVILDPAGEAFSKTAGIKAKQGYTVKVIDPTNLDRTLAYNPLVRADTTNKIAQVAATLIRSQYGESDKDRFWNAGATTILRICMKALSDCGDRFYSLHNLKFLLERLSADQLSVGSFIAAHVDEPTWAEFQAFISRSESTFQGQMASAIECLNPFTDDSLSKLTATDTLRFEELRTQRTILYIIIPEHLVKYYSFLVSLLYADLFNFLMEPKQKGEPYLPMRVIMDEFGNCGRVPSMDTYITCLRKRDVSISCLIQSLEQLKATYGASTATTILDNCGTKIFCPGLGYKTTTDLAGMLGQQSVTVDQNGEAKHLPKYLLNPDELRCLRDREALVILSNKRPWLAKMYPYYKQWRLRRMAKTAFDETFESADRPLHFVSIPTVEPQNQE